MFRKSNTQKLKKSYFLIALFFSIFLFSSSSSPALGEYNCCYHECNLTDPKQCQANAVYECRENCDADAYQDWCLADNCNISGQTCIDGVCQTSGPGCTEDWSCTDWSGCTSDKRTRICIDNNNCGTVVDKPSESRLCMFVDIIAPVDDYNATKYIRFDLMPFGGLPPYTMQWSSNIEGNIAPRQGFLLNASSWAIGTHTITATIVDANNKMASDTVDVNILPPNTLVTNLDTWTTNLLRDPVHPTFFGTITEGGTMPYSFQWRSDKAGAFSTEEHPSIDISSWALGEHQITVTVTDSAGNTATDNKSYEVLDFLIQHMSPQNNESQEEFYDAWFDVNIAGGTAPYTYLWESDIDGILSNTNSTIDTTNSVVKDNLSLGIHAITVTITDSTNASISQTNYFQITPFTPIDASINSPANNTSVQQGEDISFTINYPRGVWPFTYSWTSNLDGEINTEKDFNINKLSVGSHTITITVTDAKGNIGSDTINLTITPPVPLISTINSPVNNSVFRRIDETVGMLSTVTGGVIPYTYSWTSNIDGSLSLDNAFSKNNLSLGSHLITFTVTDAVGASHSDSVNIVINGGCQINNIKNNSKYSTKESFLVSDENWRDVLSMVPVTTWKDGSGIHAYPSLIYHKESSNFDADSSIHFLQQYEPGHLTTVGTTPASLNNLLIAPTPTGAGMNNTNIDNINTSDYFSYWSSFNSLVIVDYNNYKGALLASTLASEHNSPIIFVNSSNLSSYQSVINGKTIYTVDVLDTSVQAYINSNASCQFGYTIDELQKWYSGAVNSNKLILVNPGDLAISYSYSYNTKKSASISKMYTKMSLAAPFLAAAREEVIAFSELSDSGTNGGCSASAVISANIIQADTDASYAINNFFAAKPKFLTIVAAPQAIPDSEYVKCSSSWQLRTVEDIAYGSLDNAKRETAVGRIYGVSVSDASAHIARSINYDYLRNKTYGNSWHGISVGHDFPDAMYQAQAIRNYANASGYNAICFTGNDYLNCTLNQSPPYDNYTMKNYIAYLDHGSPYSWWGTMDYNNIPWLDLPIVVGAACLTNNYWQNTDKNFGAHMIRQGAMAYRGSTGVTFSSAFIVGDTIKELGKNSNITIGEVNNIVSYWDFSLLGDPVLQPKFKAIAW